MSASQVDIYGRSISPSARQATKLEALQRTHPRLLLLVQRADGTIELSVLSRVLHGSVQPPRACRLKPSGRLEWM